MLPLTATQQAHHDLAQVGAGRIKLTCMRVAVAMVLEEEQNAQTPGQRAPRDRGQRREFTQEKPLTSPSDELKLPFSILENSRLAYSGFS
jgi:hypothetical protein